MQSTLLPVIGTEDFKRLSFRDQVEIKALQLFSPEEYVRRVGLVGESGVVSPSSGLPDLNLSYPEQPPFFIEDLPVAFLHKYWAGYSCNFNEKWYRGKHRGITPLDEYGLHVTKLVNIHAFDFSLLALSRPLHHIFLWVRKLFHSCKEPTDQALLDACKVYTYMVHNDDVPMRYNGTDWEPDPKKLFIVAMTAFEGFITFDELNEYYPMIEPCEELDYLEWEEFVLCPSFRVYRGCDRFFYPAIPVSLYSSSRFSIKNWDFIDKVR
jgi:hypothetical protein